MRASLPLSTTVALLIFTTEVFFYRRHLSQQRHSQRFFTCADSSVIVRSSGPDLMAWRCAVETWAECGSSGTSCTPRLKLLSGTEALLSTGSDEVFVFNTHRRELTAVLVFPGPVIDLLWCHDNHLLYAASQNGVYCVCFQSLLPRSDSPSPSEMHISSESLLIREEGVLSLLRVGPNLLTLTQRDSSWVLTLYSVFEQPGSSSCEILRSFSLPMVSGALENNPAVRTRPVLMCVHSGDATPVSSSASSRETHLPDRHFCLEPVLFKLLFGVDAALAKPPVILCGLPDGRLCFLLLRPPGSRPRVLHSLEQAVIFVGASSVMESSGHAQCLVVVGEQGRVVLIKVNKGGSDRGGNTAGFTEGCIPGPVVCGCMNKNSLYYSTGSDLLVLDLSEEKEDKEQSTPETVAALHSPTSLNVCGLVALVELECNNAGEAQLLALSVRGKLQRISLPVRREEAASSTCSTQTGRSIRDLLSAIGDVCDRASALKTSIKSKNQILMHLNQVLNISFLLTASTSSEENSSTKGKPIRCHAATVWSRLLQKDALSLTCVLENSSCYVLERGWTLSITVSPLSYSPSTEGESSSTNFSFPFQNLHPGETLEVSLPLAAAGDSSFPVTVSCSLIFSLSSLLGDEAAELPGLQSCCISLPLNMLTVDWLHALQVENPFTAHNKGTFQSEDDPLQAFINSSRIRCSSHGEGGAEKYSAKLHVSSELLNETFKNRNSGLDAHQNMCCVLMDWLLERHEGVRTGQQGNKTTVGSSVIHARGPNNHRVKLTTKEVNVTERIMGQEELFTILELQIESSSLAAVCGLHHAVLSRVQSLLQRAPVRAAFTKSVQSLALRPALQRAEHLQQQIQQTRISGVSSVDVSGGRVTQSLLRVYRELRENPLLII